VVAAAAVLIVALGDSTTAGTPHFKSPIEAPPGGAGDATAPYPAWIERQHPGWRVLNRGVNGERSDQIAARFDRDVVAHHPAVVVIIAGVNDVYQGRGAEWVIGQLDAMYAKARAAGILLVAGSIVPYNTATPAQNTTMHAINDWIRDRAARDAQVTFVDTRKAAASPDNIDTLSGSPDGLHPDAAGYHRMGDAVARAIEHLITREGR
jgi:lysophospholipase L1-like esterase